MDEVANLKINKRYIVFQGSLAKSNVVLKYPDNTTINILVIVVVVGAAAAVDDDVTLL